MACCGAVRGGTRGKVTQPIISQTLERVWCQRFKGRHRIWDRQSFTKGLVDTAGERIDNHSWRGTSFMQDIPGCGHGAVSRGIRAEWRPQSPTVPATWCPTLSPCEWPSLPWPHHRLAAQPLILIDGLGFTSSTNRTKLFRLPASPLTGSARRFRWPK